jgi:hypothetical protein
MLLYAFEMINGQLMDTQFFTNKMQVDDEHFMNAVDASGWEDNHCFSADPIMVYLY